MSPARRGAHAERSAAPRRHRAPPEIVSSTTSCSHRRPPVRSARSRASSWPEAAACRAPRVRACSPGPSAPRRAPRSAELIRERGDGPLDRRAQAVAGDETRSLDRVDVEPARQAVQRSRASSTASATPKAWVEERRLRAGSGPRSGRRSGGRCPAAAPDARGVDDHDVLGARPDVRAAPSRRPRARGPRRRGASSRTRRATARPAPSSPRQRVADADDEHHARSTSRRRKCVAQEMHGS